MTRTYCSILFSLLCAFASCQTVNDSLDGPEGVVLPTEDIDIVRDITSGVPPKLVPILDAIRVALEDGDEATARRTLRRLLARKPAGRTLELALGFERILDGRERIRWLDFHLEAIELPEAPGSFRLELVVSQKGNEDLLLCAGGARIRVTQYVVDAIGGERRSSRRDAAPFPTELLIASDGAEQRWPVVQLELSAPPEVLAYSSVITLEILPGEFRTDDGRYLPVQHIPIEPLELVRLGNYLPTAAVEPQEMKEYVETGHMFGPALMERAVRILPERREEALDLLSPLVERMTVMDLEALVPALRWLARTSRPAGDPEAWRSWMLSRWQRVDALGKPSWDNLTLPRD
ncbi:MAG: hypothetical protein ACI8X5_001765 [Planctomycetota bacterium]|jgi:hypothetical protein